MPYLPQNAFAAAACVLSFSLLSLPGAAQVNLVPNAGFEDHLLLPTETREAPTEAELFLTPRVDKPVRRTTTPPDVPPPPPAAAGAKP